MPHFNENLHPTPSSLAVAVCLISIAQSAYFACTSRLKDEEFMAELNPVCFMMKSRLAGDSVGCAKAI
jgi:hypothetical protein